MVVQFHSSACVCPVFPTSLIEETVPSPLYIPGFFAVDKLTLYAQIHFRDLYSISLIYLFLYQYRIVLTAIILQSGSMVPPALFFFKIALAITAFIVGYKLGIYLNI